MACSAELRPVGLWDCLLPQREPNFGPVAVALKPVLSSPAPVEEDESEESRATSDDRKLRRGT